MRLVDELVTSTSTIATFSAEGTPTSHKTPRSEGPGYTRCNG